MKKALFVLSILLLVFIIQPNAHALTWVDIPLINPGAETGDMTGWNFAGPMAADNYEPQTMQPINPRTGSWFFSAAQPAGSLATMNQSFDISNFSSDIDSDSAVYNFGFWYQNEYWENAWDTGEGRIFFYDGASNEINSYSTGEIGNDIWTLANLQGYIPINTRTAKIEFIGRRYSGSHINAFFDDAYLRVGTPDSALVPEPATLSLLGLGLLGLVLKKKKTA